MNKFIVFFFFGVLNLTNGLGQISGPLSVTKDSSATFLNLMSSGPYYFTWEIENATILQQCDDSITCRWQTTGTFKVKLIYEDVFTHEVDSTHQFVDVLDLITVISYYYDNAGNRTEREIVYYHQGGQKRAKGVEDKQSEQSESDNIKLYPNPANYSVNVQVSKQVLEETNRRILIFNTRGNILIDTQPNGLMNSIDVSDFESGTYIVKLFYGNHSKEWQLVKF